MDTFNWQLVLSLDPFPPHLCFPCIEMNFHLIIVFMLGAICMELVRQCNGPQFLSQAVKSLTKVHELSLIPLPFASVLMAQAEGSLGSKERWERNLRCEWYTWPSGLIYMLCLKIDQITGELNVIQFLLPYSMHVGVGC